MPRLLQFIAVDGNGLEAVSRVFRESKGHGTDQPLRLSDLPAWVWLPWIPILLTSLQRPEVMVARRILAASAAAHAQTLYWHVRPCMILLKDVAVRAVQDAKSQAKQHGSTADQISLDVPLNTSAQGVNEKPAVQTNQDLTGTHTEKIDAPTRRIPEDRLRAVSPDIVKPLEVQQGAADCE